MSGVSKRKLAAGLILFGLAIWGLVWSVPQALDENRESPKLVGMTPPQLTSEGRWEVQTGDTCSGIATVLGVPGGWTELRDANLGAIKQVSVERGISYEDCPLDVGMDDLAIPDGWLPNGAVVQIWEVDHDWIHWRRATAGAFAAGFFLGGLLVALVVYRWLRRKSARDVVGQPLS